MYAKVFRQLWDGSLCGQSDAQLVFIYLLAHSDADGCVCQPAVAIAAKTGLTVDSVKSAIALLESPDPASGTDSEEGKRLVRTLPSRDEWMIVNHSKYRGMRDEEDRKRQNKEAQRRRRQPPSAPVSLGQPPSAHTEVRSQKQKSETDTPHPTAPSGARPRAPRSLAREVPGFAEWYDAYPRHKAREHAARAYAHAVRDGIDPGLLLSASARYRSDCTGLDPSKIKHPATWLNGKCWMDEADRPIVSAVPAKPKTPAKPLFTADEERPPNREEQAKVAALVAQVVARIGA